MDHSDVGTLSLLLECLLDVKTFDVAHRFDHTNSDSEDFINSDGINSEVDEYGND